MARISAMVEVLLGAFFVYAVLCVCLVYWLLERPPSFFPSYPCASDPDKDNEVLARFNSSSGSFFFGLAIAPAHVEDDLDDTWVSFAREAHTRVRSWRNVAAPEQRLRFWTEPQTELELAKLTGISMLRMGVDWGRIVPFEPIHGTDAAADPNVTRHYREIMKEARNRGLRIMVTLFHHSLPKWALSFGGWADHRMVGYFVEFARYTHKHFGDMVHYWVTFNEPHIFVLLSHCVGSWPPGVKLSSADLVICMVTPFGGFSKVISVITEAHNQGYEALHQLSADVMVGVAHHVGAIHPYSLLDAPLVLISKWFTLFSFIDEMVNHLDFCGLNFYGQEFISLAGLMLVSDEEYSEAGRGVYPNGLYELLIAFHQRYRLQFPGLKYIITENGISDARDILRRPYLIEHLLALHAAMEAGVPVLGYLHWTISDNWEWSDGYCPKFGLVDVDRVNNLTRYPRPSYALYKEIVVTGMLNAGQRRCAWEILQDQVRQGESHPFCRATDPHGRMGDQGLDVPIMRPFSQRDWRLGMHKPPSLRTLTVRSFEVIGILLSDILWAKSYVSEPQGTEEEL